MDRPLVSAIILNYCSGQQATQCADAILRQTIADQIEILIVDNHSQDDSIGIVRNRLTDERVRIIEVATNRGYGQGNNYGAGYATGKYILIINPDNALEPDGLEKMVKAMEEDPSIGIIAPQLTYDDGTIRNSALPFPTFFDVFIKRTFLKYLFPKRLKKYLQQDVNPNEVRETDWVHGACLMLKRSFFEDLKGFDPRFFLFFEDADLCRRCWKSGKKVIFYPKVHALDQKHRLSGEGFLSLLLKKTGRVHIASAIKYFWKWRGVGIRT